MQDLKKHPLVCINLLLTIAMVAYVAFAWIRHASTPMNSAPAWVTIIYSIYFLIPMGAINLTYLIVKLVRRTTRKQQF